MIVPDVEQRSGGVTPFVFSLREFCVKRMLPYVFPDGNASLTLGFVIGNIEEKLARLAAGDDAPYLTVEDWQPDTETLLSEDVRFDEMGKTRLTTFAQLISYLEYKLLDQNDGLDRAAEMISDALPPRLRETAYLLACEIAAADGDASQEELRFLQDFRITLDIDRLIAGAIERAAKARYQVI